MHNMHKFCPLEQPHQFVQIFCLFCKKKPTFFYFTYPLLQNTHISLSILHIYLIKYSFFYIFYYFLPSPLWHKLTTSSSPSTPTPSQQPFNKIQPLIHWSSTTTITTTRHNHNHNNFDPLALHVRSILRHLLRFQTDCWIGEADQHSQLTRRPNSSIKLSPWHARSPPSYRRLRLRSLRFWRRRRS